MRRGIDTSGQAADDPPALFCEVTREAARQRGPVGRAMARADDADRALCREVLSFRIEHERRIPEPRQRHRPDVVGFAEQPEAEVADASHLRGPIERARGDGGRHGTADALDLGELLGRSAQRDGEFATEGLAQTPDRDRTDALEAVEQDALRERVGRDRLHPASQPVRFSRARPGKAQRGARWFSPLPPPGYPSASRRPAHARSLRAPPHRRPTGRVLRAVPVPT